MSFLNMKARGNIQRIKEFHSMGLRADAIVSRFAAYNIHISENMVNCVINGEFDALDRVALPRSAVYDLQRELDEISSSILPA